MKKGERERQRKELMEDVEGRRVGHG